MRPTSWTRTRSFPRRCSRWTGGWISPTSSAGTGGGGAVQGNVDPAVLTAGADAARAAARDLLARVDPAGHIVNLGHGILPGTPVESVEALVEVVHGERV